MEAGKKQNSGILDRANALILSRDFEQAARIYKGLLKTEPEDITLLSSLGNLYVKSGEDEKALPYFNEVIRLSPNDTEALNALGAIYRRQKKYSESIAVLERAIAADENDTQSFYNLGFTYKLMDRHDDAIRCFTAVVEANPGDVLAFNHIGSIYARKNQHKDAVSFYLRGLKIDPNHPVLHLNLAKSYSRLGEFCKAQTEYESALKAKPGWLEAIECYADLLLKRNRTRNAGDLVKHALNLNPDDAAMHTKLGDVYSKQSKYDSAEDEYHEALRISPEYVKALSGLANAYESVGRSSDAIEVMDRVESIAPDDADMRRQYAHILLSAERAEDARKKIQVEYQKDPNDVHTLNLLGQYYICIGDEKKALGCFKKIKTIDPENTVFYRDGGKRYSQKGNLRKAEEFYLKYIAQNPDDVEGISCIARNYESQGNFVQAMSSWKQIEQVDAENCASREGISRINKRIFESGALQAESRCAADDEFLDVDEDISIGGPDVLQEEIPPAGSEQPVEPDMTEPSAGYDSSLEGLQGEGVPVEKVLGEGVLDRESEPGSQEVYSRSLDELAGESFQDEEGSGLAEDDTSAAEFFAQNPFGAGGKPQMREEADSRHEFSYEELEDGMEEEALELEADEAEDVPPARKKERPHKRPAEIKEPVMQEDEDILFEDEEIPEAEEVPETEEAEPEPEKSDRSLLEKAASQQPAPEPSEPGIPETDSTAASLFIKLRSLSNYLPEEKKAGFLESRDRLLLEYIISKFQGRKGLLFAAGQIKDRRGAAFSAEETESGIRLLLKVLDIASALASELPDEALSAAMAREIARLRQAVR